MVYRKTSGSHDQYRNRSHHSRGTEVPLTRSAKRLSLGRKDQAFGPRSAKKSLPRIRHGSCPHCRKSLLESSLGQRHLQSDEARQLLVVSFAFAAFLHVVPEINKLSGLQKPAGG